MSSGAFFPASLIHKAATDYTAHAMKSWQEKREAYIKKVMSEGRKKWSWLRLRFVREEVPRRVAEMQGKWNHSFDYLIEHPMENRWYASATKLASTAREVMDLDENATMFVSAEDFHGIREFYAKPQVKEIIA